MADLSKQAANNSYSPPEYYEDKPFKCRDCGKEEIWTAKQQQWWYEVAKGPIYSTAVRCRRCRRKIENMPAELRKAVDRTVDSIRSRLPNGLSIGWERKTLYFLDEAKPFLAVLEFRVPTREGRHPIRTDVDFETGLKLIEEMIATGIQTP